MVENVDSARRLLLECACARRQRLGEFDEANYQVALATNGRVAWVGVIARGHFERDGLSVDADLCCCGAWFVGDFTGMGRGDRGDYCRVAHGVVGLAKRPWIEKRRVGRDYEYTKAIALDSLGLWLTCVGKGDPRACGRLADGHARAWSGSRGQGPSR